jgi:hypothetical protein
MSKHAALFVARYPGNGDRNDGAIDAAGSRSSRPSRRGNPSRIVSGCGGQPGTKRSIGTSYAQPSRTLGACVYYYAIQGLSSSPINKIATFFP